MNHPAERTIEAIEAWFLALRDPIAFTSVPGAAATASGTEPRSSGVTQHETAEGRYPPHMRGVVL